MKPIPQVVSVMTPFPYHVTTSASLAEAEQLMAAHQIRHLPVYEDDDLVGIISERDLARVTSLGHHPAEETDLVVGDICTYKPYVADVGDPLDRVLEALIEHRLGAVLVMKDGETAGIFTALDACRLLVDNLQEGSASPPEDIIA